MNIYKEKIYILYMILVQYKKVYLCSILLGLIGMVPFSTGLKAEVSYFSEESSFSLGVVDTTMDIDPLAPDASYSIASKALFLNCYERLFELEWIDGIQTVVPHLASDMGTWGENSQQFEFSLRPNVKWWDGSPLTVDDVIWNLNRLKNISNNHNDYFSHWFTTDNHHLLKNIENIDDTSISITLSHPYSEFPTLLSMIDASLVKPAVILESDTYPLENCSLYVGSGPFAPIDGDSGDMVLCEQVPDYWDESPKLTDFQIHLFSSSENMTEAFLQGRINFIQNYPSFTSFNASDEFNVSESVYPVYTELFYQLSTKNIPHSVRRAMQYAFDGQSILSTSPYQNSSIYNPLPLLSGFPETSKIADSLPSFNLTQARAFLLNDSNFTATLTDLNLTALSPDNDWIQVALSDSPLGEYHILTTLTPNSAMVTEFQSMMEKIGLKITYEQMNFVISLSGFTELYHQYLEAEITLLGEIVDPPLENSQLDPLYRPYSTDSTSYGYYDIPTSWTHCQNQTLDLMLNQTYSSQGDARTDLYISLVNEILNTHAMGIHFLQSTKNALWNSDLILAGVERCLNPYMYPDFKQIEYSNPNDDPEGDISLPGFTLSIFGISCGIALFIGVRHKIKKYT